MDFEHLGYNFRAFRIYFNDRGPDQRMHTHTLIWVPMTCSDIPYRLLAHCLFVRVAKYFEIFEFVRLLIGAFIACMTLEASRIYKAN